MQMLSLGCCDRFVAAAFFFAAVGEGRSVLCPYRFAAFPDVCRNFFGQDTDRGNAVRSRACGDLSDFSAFFGRWLLCRCRENGFGWRSVGWSASVGSGAKNSGPECKALFTNTPIIDAADYSHRIIVGLGNALPQSTRLYSFFVLEANALLCVSAPWCLCWDAQEAMAFMLIYPDTISR